MSSVSTSGGRRTGAVIIAVILVIIAVLAAVAGIIYLTKTSESLPSFLPGKRTGNTGHDNVRGIVAIIVAVIALIGAGIALWSGRSQSSQG
jgi:amino acid permease